MRSPSSTLRPGVFFALTLFLASALTAAQPSGPDPGTDARPVKLILLGGQSNMAGMGRIKAIEDPALRQPFSAVKIWHNSRDTWVDIRPGHDGRTGYFGPEIAFGHAIAGSFPKAEVRLVKFAVGGSGLATQWNPKGPGRFLRRFLLETAAALADLKAAGRKVEVVGMLWMQGEQDAKDSDHPANARAYEANLTALIETVRDAVGNRRMVFVIGRIHDALEDAKPHRGKDFKQAPVVRSAMARVAKKDRRVGLVDTDGFSLARDRVHFNAEGCIQLGRAFAKELERLVRRGKR
jgi:hypothetical protein